MFNDLSNAEFVPSGTACLHYTTRAIVMKRRNFLALLSVATLLPRISAAQHTPTIGVLAVGIPTPKEFLTAFQEGLHDRGYDDGKNIQIIVQSAEGHADRLPALAAELVRRKVDVIVAFQTPAVDAARKATTEIPIVMDAGDPVGMGLVSSFAKPGGNVTGMSAVTAELAPKNLDILRQIVPSFKKLALFLNATDPFRKPFLTHSQFGADHLGIELKALMVNGAAELAPAFETAAHEKADAALVQPSLPIAQAAKLALAHRLPASSLTEAFPEAGGLMSYSANYAVLWREMTRYVDKILKGTTPADLPVEQPAKFDFVINVGTAKELSLTIPPSVLALADQTIE